ncbi:MAG: glycosyltransferase family 4 protein, partial [Planctomycetota bacterium]
MHVLMLGWEFPPFITGGLGTACFGLTRGLDKREIKVTFVLPKHVPGTEADHVSLLSPSESHVPTGAASLGELLEPGPGSPAAATAAGATEKHPSAAPRRRRPAPDGTEATFRDVDFIEIPSELASPYQREAYEGPVGAYRSTASGGTGAPGAAGAPPHRAGPSRPAAGGTTGGDEGDSIDGTGTGAPAAPSADYGGDLFQQVVRYAQFCVEAAKGLQFDVIHAHDWMTYPAGLAIARRTGKPLVVHVHSTEFDRAGEQINHFIYDLERRGMHGAMRVITVSQLTRSMVVSRYDVPESRIEVVYNGVEIEPSKIGITGIRSRDKIVLYFGRITYQKGPEYFISAAKRVLEVMNDVKF